MTSKRRPKLLFLARPFPPLRAVGCVRTWNLAKHLARLGWDVQVVTPHHSVWRHVDNPKETGVNLAKEGIRCLLTDHWWRCLSPDNLNCWNEGVGWFAGGVCRSVARRLGIDSGIGWRRAAEKACSKLTAEDVDVILATGSPFAAFKLAKRLSDRLGRPYVLDYRDPWSGNPHVNVPALAATLREEGKLLAGCSAVTIVSSSWGLALDRRFGLGSKLSVVSNGYDPEELESIEPHPFGHFAIVYTGNFYPPKRVISPMMAALKHIKETTTGNNSNWYFHYYGRQADHVCKEASRFDVREKVITHGSVSRDRALSAVKGAGVAVVIASVKGEEATLEDKGMVTAKVFEAMGLGTPSVLLAPQGSDIETIAATGGLAQCFSVKNIEGIACFLTEVMSGRIPQSRDREAFSWENLGKKMDSILRLAMEQ